MSASRSRRDRNTRLASAVLVGGGMLATLDVFVVIVALGAIRSTYPGATAHETIWAAVAFPLVSAVLVSPAGRISVRLGRGRVFTAGVVVFMVGSAMCGTAPALWMLVLGRAVQGAGAAALIATSLALLLGGASPGRRARATATWAVAGAFAAAIGPVFGGLLVPIDWRFAFLVNLVLAVPLLLGARLLDLGPGSPGPRVDWAGAVLLGGALCSAVLALSGIGAVGGAPHMFVAVLGVVVLGWWFVSHSRRVADPTIDFHLLRGGRLRAAAAVTLGFYVGFAVMIAGTAQVLICAWRLPAPEIGVLFSVGPFASMLAGMTIGRLVFSPSSLLAISGAAFAAGGLWWSVWFSSGSPTLLGYLPGVVLLGLGAGNVQSALIAAGTAGLEPTSRAPVTTLLNTARQAGTALGIAIFIAVAVSVGVAELADFRWAWACLTAVGALTAASAASLRTGAREGVGHAAAAGR